MLRIQDTQHSTDEIELGIPMTMAHPLLYVASMLLLDPTVAFIPPTAYSAISRPQQNAAQDVHSLRLVIDPSSTADIVVSADNVLDDTSAKLLISIGLAAAAVAGAFLSDQSSDGDGTSTQQSLDTKYTDPDQLEAEYRAREEALQLAMEREAELALAEERGEYNKTRADAELVSWKLAEGGSDPAGIQSSLPEVEERRVREMISEQRRLEEEGAFDDDVVDDKVVSVDDEKDEVNVEETVTSTTADIDVASADPLALVQMMEKAKAQDELAGKLDVAARISEKDSEIEQRARNILAVAFAEQEEEQDRARQQEEKRIADQQEGQRLLDIMSQTRQAEMDQLQSLVQLKNAKDDKRTNQELDEAMELASDKPAASTTEAQEATVAQILEAERAIQVEKRRIANEEFSAEMDRQKAAEAERVRQAEAQRAADIVKAQIERDMARKYNEERKAKAAEAVAAADERRTSMTSSTTERTKLEEAQAASSEIDEPQKDIPENTLLSLKKLSKEGNGERKRDKVVKLVKNKNVVGAGLAYLVGRKLAQIFFL